VDLYLLVFIAVSLGIGAGYFLLVDLLSQDASLVRRRMENEFARDPSQPAHTALFKSWQQINLDQAPGPSSELDPPERQAPSGLTELRLRLEALLDQGSVRLTVAQLLWLMTGLGLFSGVAATYFVSALLALPAAAVGAAAPLAYLYQQRNARRQKLLSQLPNAFDLMARVIRAGHSVPQALQAVADSFEPPIALEFANCQKQQNLGLRPEVTFHDLAQRTGILEVRIFVMAMLIQRQTGGNLSEVLERLAGLVRTRIRFRSHIRTLTAEGRLQGLALLVLPFLLFGALLAVNRPYAMMLLDHVPLLIATGVSMLAGVLWIRRIINFDV
jgi:tight adherence protein B